VGIFSVEENAYVPYRGDAIQTAIRLIQEADEVVTYNCKLELLRDEWLRKSKLGRRSSGCFPSHLSTNVLQSVVPAQTSPTPFMRGESAH
jgi:hypothetical protein